MNWFAEIGILHALQLTALIIAFIQYRALDKGSIFFALYLLISFLFEVLATFAAIRYHNNLIVINVFDLLQYILTIAYFSYSIPALNRKRSVYLILIGIIVWIITSLITPINQSLNTPFLVFESITIVALCHYYFYDLLNADDNRIITPSFGFVSFLFIFWSFTFTYWLFGLTLRTGMQEQGIWLGRLIWIINLVCYSGFSLVFLFYKKLQNR